MTDEELRNLWRAAGGEFHGPRVETGTMPEEQLLPFLRFLASTQGEVHTRVPDKTARLLTVSRHLVTWITDGEIRSAMDNLLTGLWGEISGQYTHPTDAADIGLRQYQHIVGE